MAANDDLRDASIKHSVYLTRYTTGTVNKLIKLLQKTDADIVSQVLNATPHGKARMNALLREVRAINKAGYETLSNSLIDELNDFAVYESTFQAGMIESAVPVGLNTTIPAEATLIAAVKSKPFQGRLLKEWLSGQTDAAAARTRDAIRLGVVEGQTVDQIARRIKGTRALNYTDGILEISRRGVQAMVRTAVNHTANVARDAYAEANKDIIKGLQWVSTLDSRTSAVCQARDGNVYPVGKGERPPAHINCRSSMTPVTKSYRELGIDIDEAPAGTRASINGQVSAKETYQSWLKKQPATFQDDILGKTKGQLFRNEGLTLDRFIDKNGSAYSLKELRKVEAKAFARLEK